EDRGLHLPCAHGVRRRHHAGLLDPLPGRHRHHGAHPDLLPLPDDRRVSRADRPSAGPATGGQAARRDRGRRRRAGLLPAAEQVAAVRGADRDAGLPGSGLRLVADHPGVRLRGDHPHRSALRVLPRRPRAL
ncbi:MAG: Cytochrome c oxidase polypeptide IV, partial [uncultured Friedmanniella sp.]